MLKWCVDFGRGAIDVATASSVPTTESPDDARYEYEQKRKSQKPFPHPDGERED